MVPQSKRVKIIKIVSAKRQLLWHLLIQPITIKVYLRQRRIHKTRTDPLKWHLPKAPNDNILFTVSILGKSVHPEGVLISSIFRQMFDLFYSHGFRWSVCVVCMCVCVYSFARIVLWWKKSENDLYWFWYFPSIGAIEKVVLHDLDRFFLIYFFNDYILITVRAQIHFLYVFYRGWHWPLNGTVVEVCRFHLIMKHYFL